jgi:hypothetical protein
MDIAIGRDWLKGKNQSDIAVLRIHTNSTFDTSRSDAVVVAGQIFHSIMLNGTQDLHTPIIGRSARSASAVSNLVQLGSDFAGLLLTHAFGWKCFPAVSRESPVLLRASFSMWGRVKAPR